MDTYIDINSWHRRFIKIKEYLYPFKMDGIHKRPTRTFPEYNFPFIMVLSYIDLINDKEKFVEENRYYCLAVENYLGVIERAIEESKKSSQFAETVLKNLSECEDISTLHDKLKTKRLEEKKG